MEHVDGPLSLLPSSTLNEGDLISPYEMITTPNTNLQSIDPSFVIIRRQYAPFNVMVIGVELLSADKPPDDWSMSVELLGGHERQAQSSEMSLLSKQVATQLSLGSSSTTRLKHRCAHEPLSEMFKQAYIRPIEELRLYCSPTHL